MVEVARLQEEMEVQGRAHQLRTSEMQDACQAKIRELHRGHEQQLAAAAQWQLSSSAAEQQAEQAAAALGALETKVNPSPPVCHARRGGGEERALSRWF